MSEMKKRKADEPIDSISFLIKETNEIYKTTKHAIDSRIPGSLLARMIDPQNEDLVNSSRVDGHFSLTFPSNIYPHLFHYLQYSIGYLHEAKEELSEDGKLIEPRWNAKKTNPLLEYDWSLSVEECDRLLKDSEYFLLPVPDPAWKLTHSLRRLNEWPMTHHYTECARFMFDLLCSMLSECFERLITIRSEDSEIPGTEIEPEFDIKLWDRFRFTLSLGDSDILQRSIGGYTHGVDNEEIEPNTVVFVSLNPDLASRSIDDIKAFRSIFDTGLSAAQKQLMLKSFDLFLDSSTNHILMENVDKLFIQNGIGAIDFQFNDIRTCDIDLDLRRRFVSAHSYHI